MILGVDGIIGLEYVFDGVPINLSLDYKPSFNITPGFFDPSGGALSIRYYF
mgnify:CR=1 FL=1